MNRQHLTERHIKLWFTDMWKDFDFENNYFSLQLRRYFNIEFNPRPDFLIHSVYTQNYLNYKCCRICYTGENIRPDFTLSDFHIGFDYNENPAYLRWPIFLMGRYMPECLLQEKNIDTILAQKKRFCSFVVSNDSAKERNEFFQRLNEYKKVDSGGRFLNNIGSPVIDKLNFLKESKFNIAYENESYPGYTTEKIFDAFMANCIPIYWGSPRTTEDFNENAYINVHNFKTNKELISYIQYLEENEEVYKAMLGETAFSGNEIPQQFQVDKFIAFFYNIFTESKKAKRVYKFANKI